MVLTDWLRHRSFARGQTRKRCRHGDETSRWRATVSRQVEALEKRRCGTVGRVTAITRIRNFVLRPEPARSSESENHRLG